MRITQRQLRQIIREEVERGTRINEIDPPGLTAADRSAVFNKQAPKAPEVAAFDVEVPERKGYEPKALGKKISGGLTADPEAFVARVTKAPLKVGSRGDDVKVAQVYLVQALKEIGSRPHPMPEPLSKNIQKLADSGELTGDGESALIRDLAKKIEASGPDGIYGRMTELATRIVQDAAVSMTPGQPIIKQDGIFGRDTAITVINGFKRATGIPAAGEQLEEGAIIGRWNRLAGLIKS